MFLKYSLAEKLGRTLAEIDAIPEEEFHGWLAYYEAKEALRSD